MELICGYRNCNVEFIPTEHDRENIYCRPYCGSAEYRAVKHDNWLEQMKNKTFQPEKDCPVTECKYCIDAEHEGFCNAWCEAKYNKIMSPVQEAFDNIKRQKDC